MTEKVRRFVSRGGDKLEAALLHFDIKVGGLVCLDVGASTGGFTDCLLKRGAKKVYAVDVGYGQLDWNLRNDPKVVVMERINVRYLNPALLQDRIDLVTIDVAFISLTKVLPKIREIVSPSPRRGEVPDEGHWGEGGRRPGEGGTKVIALIKPNFELTPKEAKKGVVRDPALHEKAIRTVTESALHLGFKVVGMVPSPLTGPKGNHEFLILLQS